jgi:small-conductance mechanosensitive channel
MSTSILIYLIAIGALAGFALIRTLLWLGKLRRRRERFLEQQHPTLETLPTTSPLSDPGQVSMDRGIGAVHEHFAITRRLVVPAIVLFAAFLASIPFLELVPTAIASLIVGIAAVVIGIAAKPFIENAIAGLVISTSRQFHIGDTVKLDGHYGTIEDISTTHTTIKIWDWRRYVVPNSALLHSKVLNYSLNDNYQWAYVEFVVSYQADLERIQRIAIDAIKSSSHFSGVEEPQFWVMECRPECLVCWVAGWANSPSDAWMLTHEARTELALAMRREGISTHAWIHEEGAKKPPTTASGRLSSVPMTPSMFVE